MLVNDLARLNRLDARIDRLHQLLHGLYKERAACVRSAPGKQAGPFAAAMYNSLVQQWQRLSIEIPPFERLQRRLHRSEVVIKHLEGLQTASRGQWKLLLVPPTSVIGSPSDPRLTRLQTAVKAPDYVDPALKPLAKQVSWRLLVVYAASQALTWGSAQAILSQQANRLGRYDLTALGTHEYYALTLQYPEPLDENHSLWLLKGVQQQDRLAPTVSLYRGQYRYEMDETTGGLDDERFRPAVVIP